MDRTRAMGKNRLISAQEKEEFLNNSQFLSGIRCLRELSNVPGSVELALVIPPSATVSKNHYTGYQ